MKKACKFLFVAALIVLMLASVVACAGEPDPSTVTPVPGGNSSEQATPTPTNGDQEKHWDQIFTHPGETYKFYSWQYASDQPYAGDTERDAQMRERVNKIQTEQGIEINFVPGSQISALLQSAFQGSPEVTGQKEGGLHTMMNTYLYQNLTGRCLEPLSDHGDVYNFNDENKFNVYSQYDLCEYNDKLWFFIPIELGVHFECGGNALVFNKKLLEAAGISADTIYGWVDSGEWTWEKFEQCLVATTQADINQWGIERGNQALIMWSLANSNGTEFVELVTLPSGQKQDSFVYTGDKGERLMAAYDEFIKLANDLKVMETTMYPATSVTPLQHFLSGNVAFFYNGYSSNPLKDIAQAEFDYGLVPWPKGPNMTKDDPYQSFYPHLNPYCIFRDQRESANLKGAVQVLCELYTPIYDANSDEAIALYQSERLLFTRDEASAKNLDIVENNKVHFRVFMYANAPLSLNDAKYVQEALFGKGEDAILNQTNSASVYFRAIQGAINNAIYARSPYSWK